MTDTILNNLSKNNEIVNEDAFLRTEYNGSGDSIHSRFSELKNTIAGVTTYIHPRKIAEYAGNIDYNSTSNWSFGTYSRMVGATRVSRIRTPFFMRNITGVMPIIEMRVYRSMTPLMLLGGQNPQSNLTFVHSNLFFKGQMPTSSSSPTWISLDSEITLADNEYLYVFAYAHSGCHVGTRCWYTAPISGPSRVGLIYNSNSSNNSSNWFTASVQTTWSQGSPIDLGTVPLLTEANYTNALVTSKQDVFNFGLTSIPQILYLAVGREMNIFNDELFSFGNGQAITVDYNCSKGQLRDRGFRFLPVIGDIGDTSLIITVYDINMNIINQQTLTIRVVSNTSGTGNKNILCIGDSLTFLGTAESSWRPTIVDELNNLITSDGGISATFIGKRGAAPALSEGRPGWKFSDFVGLGPSYFRFTVSGISVNPDFTKSSLVNGSEYTVAGNTYRIEDAFLSGGSGTLICYKVSGSGTPSASGTLTKSSLGAGDTYISYTGFTSVNSSPFWDGTRLNLQNYISVNGLAAPDIVVIQLGVNDSFSGRLTQREIDDIAANAKTFIDAIVDSTYGYPSAKIVISLPPFGAAGNNAFGVNYGSGFTPENFKRNLRRLWADLVQIFQNGNYSANVRIAAAGLFVDRVYGFPSTTRAISARVATTETILNNGVHPNNSGYQQIADSIYSVIRSFY